MTDVAIQIPQYRVVEIELGPASGDRSEERDVEFVVPTGQSLIVPAFITRGVWRVRYAHHDVGLHTWRSGDRSGEVVVLPQAAPDSRLAHGPLVVSATGRYLEHRDGEPFLWLADTWWDAFVSAKCGDAEFAELAERRAVEGFSVVQLSAGLPPELAPFDPAGEATAGWPWTPGFAELNLEWWDDADRRIQMLVERDLVPCIVGFWGFYLSILTLDQAIRHWREMIARWGAYPVVWCLAGEPQLLWYEDLAELVSRRDLPDAGRSVSEWGLDAHAEQEAAVQRQLEALNKLAPTVRRLDPFGRLLTTHATTGSNPWDFVDDTSLIDFWFLQTGHYGHASLGPTIDAVRAALDVQPHKPVVNGEACYEGIGGSSGPDIQRFLFWSQFLLGGAGVSYGAHGVWAFNTARFPGQFSGRAPDWRAASRLPGGRDLGRARQILSGYPWHELVHSADATLTERGAGAHIRPYTARLPDGRRLVYCPSLPFNGGPGRLEVSDLTPEPWIAIPIELSSGDRFPSIPLHPDPNGVATLPGLFWPLPDWSDWLIEVRRA